MPPTIDIRNLPCLAGTAPTPLLMTGLLVEWLRQHFVSTDSIENDGLKQPGNEFVWSDASDSPLVIESASNFEVSKLERRPALLVKRTAWHPQKISIANAYHGIIQPDGSRQYILFCVGGHTIFCLAGEGGEAEKLAGEVAFELLRFAPLLRRMLDLKQLALAEVGDLGRLEEATENYVVPITVSYAFEDSWKITPQDAPSLHKANWSI